MVAAAGEKSNFWCRELVNITKHPITENSYGSNRDSGLSVPFPPPPMLVTPPPRSTVPTLLSVVATGSTSPMP